MSLTLILPTFRPHKCPQKQSLQTSLDLLSISHRFIFDEIFQHVLGELQLVKPDIPAIEMFSIGQKYNIEKWLLSAYDMLLKRATPLTAHEVEVLGPDKVVQYIRDREAIHEARLQTELEKERKKHEVATPLSAWNPTPPPLQPVTQTSLGLPLFNFSTSVLPPRKG